MGEVEQPRYLLPCEAEPDTDCCGSQRATECDEPINPLFAVALGNNRNPAIV